MGAPEYRLDQQISAVKREIAMRERAYPRWVASAKMKPEKSVYELGVMRAVLETLEGLQAGGRLEMQAIDAAG
jgi:hypothetical protein